MGTTFPGLSEKNRPHSLKSSICRCMLIHYRKTTVGAIYCQSDLAGAAACLQPAPGSQHNRTRHGKALRFSGTIRTLCQGVQVRYNLAIISGIPAPSESCTAAMRDNHAILFKTGWPCAYIYLQFSHCIL